MADDNRISSTSKRGGAIVATLSAVFLLYDSGWANIGDEIRLPILNVSVGAEKALLLIYVSAGALFVNWIIKIVIDASFPGDRTHDRLRELANVFREFEDRESDASARCIKLERQLKDYLNQTASGSMVEIRSPSLNDGFDVKGLKEAASPEAKQMFERLSQSRNVITEFSSFKETFVKANRNAIRSDVASGIQAYVSYVAFPTALFFACLLNGLDNWADWF